MNRVGKKQKEIKPRIDTQRTPYHSSGVDSNCIQYVGDRRIECKRRDIPNFDTLEYRPSSIRTWLEENEFTSDPFVYGEDYSEKNEEQICNPPEYSLQPHQKFAAQIISNNTNINGNLIFNGLGSGKTCTSLVIAENMKSKMIKDGQLHGVDGKSPYHVYIVVPPALVSQYRDEIIGNIKNNKIISCTGSCVIADNRQYYVSNSSEKYRTYSNLRTKKNIGSMNQREKLEYNAIMRDINTRIDSVYSIESHITFLNKLINNKNKDYFPTEEILKDPSIQSENSLLIIDEIQKIISDDGTYFNKLNYSLNVYARSTSGKPTMKVVVMTATPVFDNPYEGFVIFNLFRPRIPLPIRKEEFKNMFIQDNRLKNTRLLKYCISGYVSYFKGGNPNGYPFRINHVVEHKMSSVQQRMYEWMYGIEYDRWNKKNRSKKKREEEEEVGFFPKCRQYCNIVFPDEKEVNEFEEVEEVEDTYDTFLNIIKKAKSEDVLKDMSPKMMDILYRIHKCTGKVFVYSTYVLHGLLSMASILEKFGYVMIRPNMTEFEEGVKYFGVWSPSVSKYYNFDHNEYTNSLRNLFNSEYNRNGNICKIILSSVVEGISLVGVSHIHMMDPWWNQSKMEQIIARGIRLCSHYQSENKVVDVYYHCMVGEHSLDKMIYRKSFLKQQINVECEQLFKEASTDCLLNREGNLLYLEPFLFVDCMCYYDRTENKYWFRKNSRFVRKIPDLSEWPPKKWIDDDDTLDYNTIVRSGESVTYRNKEFNIYKVMKKEKITCELGDYNFEQLRKIAIEKGEESSVWDYAMVQYKKKKYYEDISRYTKRLTDTSSIKNSLLQILLNNHRYFKNREDRERRVGRLEKIFFRGTTEDDIKKGREQVDSLAIKCNIKLPEELVKSYIHYILLNNVSRALKKNGNLKGKSLKDIFTSS